MKILALSDLHGDRTLVQKMAEKGAQEKVDLVLLAGDIFHGDQPKPGLISPFVEKGLEVALIPGNHECLAEIETISEIYNIKNLHGYALQKGDIGIFGCGYGDVGLHQFDDQQFFSTLKKAHDQLKGVKKKIMVTHVQPSDSLLGLGIFPGSKGVRKAVEQFQPDLHLCGHIHESHGIEEMVGRTKVINLGKHGRIIEI
jgi:Icc-related predicted phosphoesterase